MNNFNYNPVMKSNVGFSDTKQMNNRNVPGMVHSEISEKLNVLFNKIHLEDHNLNDPNYSRMLDPLGDLILSYPQYDIRKLIVIILNENAKYMAHAHPNIDENDLMQKASNVAANLAVIRLGCSKNFNTPIENVKKLYFDHYIREFAKSLKLEKNTNAKFKRAISFNINNNNRNSREIENAIHLAKTKSTKDNNQSVKQKLVSSNDISRHKSISNEIRNNIREEFKEICDNFIAERRNERFIDENAALKSVSHLVAKYSKYNLNEVLDVIVDEKARMIAEGNPLYSKRYNLSLQASYVAEYITALKKEALNIKIDVPKNINFYSKLLKSYYKNYRIQYSQSHSEIFDSKNSVCDRLYLKARELMVEEKTIDIVDKFEIKDCFSTDDLNIEMPSELLEKLDKELPFNPKKANSKYLKGIRDRVAIERLKSNLGLHASQHTDSIMVLQQFDSNNRNLKG